MKDRIKPWYIWFSVLALFTLSGDTSRRIKLSNKNFGDNFDLWLKACGHILKLIVLYVFIPLFMLSTIADRLLRDVPSDSIIMDIAVSIILLIVYFLGVYATYKHVNWRNKNIPHLLTASVQEETSKNEDCQKQIDEGKS